MTKRNALRSVLVFPIVAALAGSAGVSHARLVAPADATGQPPDQPGIERQMLLPVDGNLPIVRSSSRQAGSTEEGMVQDGRLIHMTTPFYPPAAVQAHISGVVTIQALIGKDGRILKTSVVSGPLALRRVAQYAVKRWRYEPTLLNGKPIERLAQVDLTFVLGRY
ncbi:MAG: energy transducer TonB [Bryobacteraceae bacterium]